MTFPKSINLFYIAHLKPITHFPAKSLPSISNRVKILNIWIFVCMQMETLSIFD